MKDKKVKNTKVTKVAKAVTKKIDTLIKKVSKESAPTLMRSIGNIGKNSKKNVSEANDLMKQNVGSLLKGLDGESPTADNLMKLRSAMDELNPHSLHNSWWLGLMPTPIKRYAVAKFINKYQPMNDVVTGILDGLRGGQDELLEVSLDLENQYKVLEKSQSVVKSDIQVAEGLFTHLETLEKSVDKKDIKEVQKLSSAKNKTARKIRDFRTIEQAIVQFFISIDQTVNSNSLLTEQIDSALIVGPLVMNNALRIQAGLAKQKKVQEAVNNFQEGLGNMMADNAKSVNMAAQEIGKLYNNPVIALEKMEEGFDQLMQAVNTANDVMAKSTISAREASARLESMTNELSPVAAGMHEINSQRDTANALVDDFIEGEVVHEVLTNGVNNDK